MVKSTKVKSVIIKNELTVFTKPWPSLPLGKLGKLVKSMGLDGVELQVRPGYQVTPDKVTKGLKRAVMILANEGVKIGSVAGSADVRTITAMGEAGVKILRVCVGIDMSIGYKASEEKIRREYDALIPILDEHGVSIGVQNHCDYCVGSAVGIMHLIENYAPKHVSAVLDPAHCAVDGEPGPMALDIVWSHLSLINFKSAYHHRLNGPEAFEAKWQIRWTTAPHSGYSWLEVVDALRQRKYAGDICLPAEYDGPNGGMAMGDEATPMLAEDIKHIKYLLSREPGEGVRKITDWQTGVPR